METNGNRCMYLLQQTTHNGSVSGSSNEKMTFTHTAATAHEIGMNVLK
jgi:hypothetical protein